MARVAEAFVIALISALLAMVLVGVVRWDALRRGLLDAPSARSSHDIPTPRGGGVGIVVAFGGILSFVASVREMPGVLPAAIAVLLVAAVGWLDDHGGVRPRWRLLVHLAAALLVLPLVARLPAPIPLGAAGAFWWAFWSVAAVNVVNFMDGIDGIIAVQGIAFAATLAAIASPGGAAHQVALVLGGCCAGFLVWNWSPARIFLGDVGSGALGMIFVLAGALVVAEGGASFVGAFAVLLPIFLDATVTLARRAGRGARLSDAHREHLYQRLANGGWGHSRVTLAYGAVSAVLGAAVVRWPHPGLPSLGAAIAVVYLLGWAASRTLRPSGPAMLP